MKATSIVIGVLVVLFVVLPAATLGTRWFWAPKFAAVEREVFMETRSYNQGVIQQLAKYKAEYDRADNQQDRDAIKSAVRTMFSEYDPSRIDNPALANFLMECF